MRFSTILSDYYRIRLSQDQRDLLDIHFSGAAHHRSRAFEIPDIDIFDFHFSYYYQHLYALMTLVYEHAEFSEACDPCNEGMNKREKWNPKLGCPDPALFEKLGAHPNFGLLQVSYWDQYLEVAESKAAS